VAILDEAGELLGLAEPVHGGDTLQPRHVFCVERN
jgi:hypothetical protein